MNEMNYLVWIREDGLCLDNSMYQFFNKACEKPLFGQHIIFQYHYLLTAKLNILFSILLRLLQFAE